MPIDNQEDPAPKAALLLTPKQAAAALAISPRKLWGLTASGELPAVRISRSVRYDVRDLEAFITTNKQGAQ